MDTIDEKCSNFPAIANIEESIKVLNDQYENIEKRFEKI